MSLSLCQLPITTQRSEPEPDLAIVCGTHNDYRQHHPTGADCRLIIEVADTSLEKDRSKAAIYREAGVQEYWIININEKTLECYDFTQTTPTTQMFAADARMTLSVGDSQIEINLSTILS
ncbi:MAG: Uma2 family endonuclease [Planctomycetales bacterium]|nr:Uma2 family endonuclease [Planctomycetales bacterium]